MDIKPNPSAHGSEGIPIQKKCILWTIVMIVEKGSQFTTIGVRGQGFDKARVNIYGAV